jgi:hypothetical protein
MTRNRKRMSVSAFTIMTLQRFLLLAICALILGASLQAQIPQRRGTIEASIYAGGSFDFPGAGSAVADCPRGQSCVSQINLGRKTQPILGGQVAVSIMRFLWVYGDFGYMFEDDQRTSVSFSGLTDTNTTSRQYWTATGGVELSFPTIHRVVPFVKAGAGVVHHEYESVTSPNYLALYPSVRSASEEIPSGTAGGGIKWFWNERQGLRFEADGFFLGHGVEQAAYPGSGVGIPYVTRSSGGRIIVGYFRHFGH